MKLPELEQLEQRIERNHSACIGGLCLVILIQLIIIGIILFK